jgi:GT2 family glycosyltransferase
VTTTRNTPQSVDDTPHIPARSTASVVVPTRDRAERLDCLLDVLLADPATGEVVVVDDGSTDGTAELLARRAAADARVVPVTGPRRGPLMARVTGVEAAGFAVVVLLDDDVLPDPGLVTGHLVRHRATPAEDVLVLGYMPTRVPSQRSSGDFTTRLYAAEYEGRCASYDADPANVLTYLWMGNLSVGRERFLDVSSRWTEPLPAFRHEDTEIGLRLASLGVRPVFDRSLHGVHEHRRTLAQFRRDCRSDGAGLAQLERHHPGVLGAAGTARFRTALPAPLAAVVAASARPMIGRATAGALALGVRAAGGLGVFGPQTALARVLRRVEQQAGYLAERRLRDRAEGSG